MIAGAGNPPKRIAEYVGRLNTESVALSIARTVSPGAGKSPGKLPSLMSILWCCGAQSALKLFAVPERRSDRTPARFSRGRQTFDFLSDAFLTR